MNEKSFEKILIYEISYKVLIGTKSWRIMFDESIRANHKTKYLVLFNLEKYNAICNRIIYLLSLKGGIKYTFSHSHVKIKLDSDED